METPVTTPRDRRHRRATIWPCRKCGANDTVRVVLRTEHLLYLRCRCGCTWNQSKPDHERRLRFDN